MRDHSDKTDFFAAREDSNKRAPCFVSLAEKLYRRAHDGVHADQVVSRFGVDEFPFAPYGRVRAKPAEQLLRRRTYQPRGTVDLHLNVEQTFSLFVETRF